MLQPTGPLPPEIYWRRRLFALGALAVALVVVVWLIIVASGGGDSPEAAHHAAPLSSAAESTTELDPLTTTPETTTPSLSAAAPVTTTPGTVAAPVEGGQCPDQSLAIKVTVEQPTYRIGQQPVFQIVITNISTQLCRRDLSSMQQVLVYTTDSNTRLWSNTDCYPPGAATQASLNPGQQAAFRVTWAGSTAQPGCRGDRVPVQPGSYVVYAQLGALRSAPEPFNIAP